MKPDSNRQKVKMGKIDRLRRQNTNQRLKARKRQQIKGLSWNPQFGEVNFDAKGDIGYMATLNRILVQYMSFFFRPENFLITVKL